MNMLCYHFPLFSLLILLRNHIILGVNVTVTADGTICVGNNITVTCKIDPFTTPPSASWNRNGVPLSTCTSGGICTTDSLVINGITYSFLGGSNEIKVSLQVQQVETGIQWNCDHNGITYPYTFSVQNECEPTTDDLSNETIAAIAASCSVIVIVIIIVIICCLIPRVPIPIPVVPKVFVSIWYYEIPNGYRVTLLVVVESVTTVNKISWQKKVGNEFIPIQHDSNTLKYEGSIPNEPSLTILDVCQDDSGIYQCSATNLYGTGRSTNTATLFVAANAQAYKTTFGSSVDLLPSLCDTKNVTSVKWKHDRDQTLVFEDVDVSMYKGGIVRHPSLTIPCVSLEDVGTWRCFLETETSKLVTDAQLKTKEKYMEAKVGSKVVLFPELCEINGIEKVEWRHNNQAPGEHGNFLVNGRPSYTIENAVCENSGTWLCILQLRNSPKSKKTYRVQLEVKDKGNSSLPPIKGVTNN